MVVHEVIAEREPLLLHLSTAVSTTATAAITPTAIVKSRVEDKHVAGAVYLHDVVAGQEHQVHATNGSLHPQCDIACRSNLITGHAMRIDGDIAVADAGDTGIHCGVGCRDKYLQSGVVDQDPIPPISDQRSVIAQQSTGRGHVEERVESTCWVSSSLA